MLMLLTYKWLLLLLLLLLNRWLEAAVCNWHMWLNQLIGRPRLTVRSSLCCHTGWLPLQMQRVLPF
jgi:hypothetical protein